MIWNKIYGKFICKNIFSKFWCDLNQLTLKLTAQIFPEMLSFWQAESLKSLNKEIYLNNFGYVKLNSCS